MAKEEETVIDYEKSASKFDFQIMIKNDSFAKSRFQHRMKNNINKFTFEHMVFKTLAKCCTVLVRG